MKKIILLAIASTFSLVATAAPAFKAVSTCEYDYDDINFCSKSNIAKYKTALKTQKPNFDSKYILLNVGPSSKKNRYVAIDASQGLVYPLSDEIIGFKDRVGGLTGKPAIINYSIDNSYLCIKGSISAYRDSYDNVKACYSVHDDEYSKYGKEFSRLPNLEDLSK